MCREAYTLATEGEYALQPYTHGIVAALRTQSILNMWRGAYHAAIAEGEHALELLRHEPHPELEAQILCALAIALLSAGELEHAMQIALRALERANTLQQPEIQGYAFDALCHIYARVGDWTDALQMAQRARDHAVASRNFRAQTFIQNNLAWIYLQAGDTAVALTTIQDCLTRAQTAGYPLLYLAALGTAGEIYVAQHDFANAIETCNLFLAQAHEHGMQNEMVYARRYLGTAYWQHGNVTTALQHYHDALTLATEFNLPLEQAECHHALAQIFEGQSDFQNALHHYKAYQQLREQVVYKTTREIHTLELLERLKTAQNELERVYRETEFLHAEVQAHKHERQTLYELATVDALTTIANRRHFAELAEQYLQTRSDLECVTLLVFDIDRFKEINDTHGHSAGDTVLQTVTRRVQEFLRAQDLFGRLGGDEFVILLPNTCGAEAKAIAERLRHAVATRTVFYYAEHIHVSLSIGAVYCAENETAVFAALLDAADRALYQAKRGGRNRALVLKFTPSTRTSPAHPSTR